jgi:hypothetical protein
MSASEWAAWVQHDTVKQAALLQETMLDERSPEDIMEDLVPEKRLINEIHEPVYDLVQLAEKNEYGPFSEKVVFPEILHV